MIRLDCAGRASAIRLLTALVVLIGTTSADAKTHPRPTPHHNVLGHAAVPLPMSRPELTALAVDPTPKDSAVVLSEPTLSIITDDKVAAADTPTIVRPGRRIYCVEFARLVSGIALFGDARTWWPPA